MREAARGVIYSIADEDAKYLFPRRIPKIPRAKTSGCRRDKKKGEAKKK